MVATPGAQNAALANSRAKSEAVTAQGGFAKSRNVFFASFAIFMAVFIVSLLTTFPGQCSPDSEDIINQALGVSHYSDTHRYEGLSAHHPPFYTFLVWIALAVSSWMGDIHYSIAVAIVFQGIYVAAAISAAVGLLNECGAPKWATILAIAFLAFTPVLATHVVTLWKDAPFSASTLLLCAYIAYLLHMQEVTWQRAVWLTAIMLPICLLRSNGLIVCIITSAVLAVAFARGRVAVILSAAFVVAVSLVVSGPIYGALSISKAHFSEAMALPIQQIAAAAHEDARGLHDAETLDRILPIERWGKSYDPTTANPIKFDPAFDDAYLESHKAAFLMAWIRNAPDHVWAYAGAWAEETRGYWQPGYQSVIGYGRTIGNAETMNYLHLGTNPTALSNSPRLRGLLPPLFSMGTYIWLLLGAMTACAVIGGRKGLALCAVPLAPVLAIFATLLLAAPIVDDFRYILPLFLALALIPAFIVQAVRTRAR